MLVLSRKPDERILIGDDVKITVIRIGPNSVRIGIDAPKHLTILREELAIAADPQPMRSELPAAVEHAA